MDIVVLGGGVIGLAMANLLAKHGHAVALLCPTNGQDVRYSAISHTSQNILRHLDVWNDIIADKPGVYDQMYLWDHHTQAEITIRASDLGVDALGHIINNKVIVDNLSAKLSNITVIRSTAKDVKIFKDYALVQTDDQEIICKLVIAADGANSWTRRHLQIPAYNWDYQHTAIVTVAKMPQAHNNTARQRFDADGTLAYLPLAERDLCAIVWSVIPSKAEQLMQLPPGEFAAEISADGICSAPVQFPLHMLHAKHYTLPRVALVGDSAHVIHPLAGQGMNLGLLDAAVLAECLEGAKDVGDHKILRRYERIRKSHNWGMIGIIEGCKRLFGIDHPLVNTLRRFGMNGIDQLPLCKNFIAKLGIGKSVLGELPASAKESYEAFSRRA